MTDHRRGKVNDEHKEEARRLREIWNRKADDLRASDYGTQEKFGAKFGIGNQAAVGFFLNGRTALSVKAAKGFAEGLGCAVADFSPRLAQLMMQPERPAEPFEFGVKYSKAGLELAEEFDKAPMVVKRRLFALLLDEIRRAKESVAAAQKQQPSAQPRLSRAPATKKAPGRSRAAT